MMAKIVSPLPFSRVFVGLLLLFLTSTTQASYVFTGGMIDVSYSGPDFSVGVDSIIAGSKSPDIAYQDGSNIGDGIMIDFESIEFFDTAIIFTLRGDGPEHSTGYQKTGLLGSYVISLVNANLWVDDLTVTTSNNVTGVALGSEITFDAQNIYFDLSTFGVLDQTNEDLATISLDVSFIPLPAALPLMLSGLVGLLLFARRQL